MKNEEILELKKAAQATAALQERIAATRLIPVSSADIRAGDDDVLPLSQVVSVARARLTGYQTTIAGLERETNEARLREVELYQAHRSELEQAVADLPIARTLLSGGAIESDALLPYEEMASLAQMIRARNPHLATVTPEAEKEQSTVGQTPVEETGSVVGDGVNLKTATANREALRKRPAWITHELEIGDAIYSVRGNIGLVADILLRRSGPVTIVEIMTMAKERGFPLTERQVTQVVYDGNRPGSSVLTSLGLMFVRDTKEQTISLKKN